MKKSHLTLKIFALIILNDIGESIAQLVMKKGLSDAGILSALVWLGISIYIVNFFIWIVVLYKIDLSIALPVGSASFIIVPLAAVVFLHERISPARWLGIICIILGVHFVMQSKKPLKEGEAA